MTARPWEPFGADEALAASDKIDKSTIDKALACLEVKLTDASKTRMQILNHLDALVIDLHRETRPGSKQQKATLGLLHGRLLKASGTLSCIDRPTLEVLAKAAEQSSEFPLHINGDKNLGEWKVARGLDALHDMIAWTERAINVIPSETGGAPRKAAVLECVSGLAKVYLDIFGRAPGRSVSAYTDPNTENGRFRKFVNIMLQPLGANASEHIVRQAIGSIDRPK